MPTTKDYYQSLGIPKDATPDQIKQAYRKLAREHHPDMVKDGDKAKAEERFKEINEAYQILSDPQKRKMYDQFGHTGPGQGFGGFGASGFGGNQGFGGQGSWGPFTYTYTNGSAQSQGFGDFDPFDVFEDFFGFRGFGGGRRPRHGKNLYYEMEISFADAVHGVEKTVKTQTGDLKVKIPAGAYDGLEMKFAGKGMPGPDNVPYGDLYITFRVPTPKEFERAVENLGVVVEIDAIEAAIGTVAEVTVIDPSKNTGIGTAQMKIPAGTQYGAQIRLKGKGMPRVRGDGFGDVIVQVAVTIPKKLSKKQKELLEEYLRN